MARQPTVTIRDSGAEAPAAAPTPSEELIAKALQPEVITDAKGRKITMRKPGPLAQFRLMEALGPLAANTTYLQSMMPLLFIGDIDGDPLPQPKTKLEYEALITRLDDAGLDACMAWFMLRVIGPGEAALDAATKAEEDRAALKN